MLIPIWFYRTFVIETNYFILWLVLKLYLAYSDMIFKQKVEIQCTVQ